MRLAVPDRGWPRNGSHLESGHRPAVFRVDLAPADRKRAAGVEGLLPALSGTGGAAWRGLRAGERELACKPRLGRPIRSEEHTSELQSLMRNSYAVFCLTKKKNIHTQNTAN